MFIWWIKQEDTVLILLPVSWTCFHVFTGHMHFFYELPIKDHFSIKVVYISFFNWLFKSFYVLSITVFSIDKWQILLSNLLFVFQPHSWCFYVFCVFKFVNFFLFVYFKGDPSSVLRLPKYSPIFASDIFMGLFCVCV